MDVTTYFPGNGDSVSIGLPHYSTSFDGYLYFFANETNLNKFLLSPTLYLPKYGGFCSFGVATEYEIDGYSWNATNLGPPVSLSDYKVINGSLYMFYSSTVAAEFLASFDTMVAEADDRWKRWFPDPTTALINTACVCDDTEDDDDGTMMCYW